MLLDGVAIEYVPGMGYMHIICELPFLTEEGLLYVENMDPEAEDFLVSSIELLAENFLKVSLSSGDVVNVISHFKTGNYLFKKIIGDFKEFNARNWGDDKLKIVTNGDKLGSFELYRTRDNDSFLLLIYLKNKTVII